MVEYKTCPKCGGKMHPGKKSSMGDTQRWIAEGKKWIWNTKGITTFACSECGFIEDYLVIKK